MADRAAGGAQHHVHGLLDREPLRARPLDHLQVRERPEQVAGDVERVGAVVDQHAAAALGAVRVPAAAHVDVGRERVLEQHRVAEGAGGDQAPGAHHVGDEAELRRHRDAHAGTPRGVDHRARVGGADRERLLAQHVQPRQRRGRRTGAGGRRAVCRRSPRRAPSPPASPRAWRRRAPRPSPRAPRRPRHARRRRRPGAPRRGARARPRRSVRCGPRRPARDAAARRSSPPRQRRVGSAHRVREVLDVLGFEPLVPRQHQRPLQPGDRAREPPETVVQRLRPRQGERVASSTRTCGGGRTPRRRTPA